MHSVHNIQLDKPDWVIQVVQKINFGCEKMQKLLARQKFHYNHQWNLKCILF